MNAADSSGWDPKLKSPAIEPISGSLRTLCTCKTSFGTATVIDGIPSQEYETWVAGFENYTFDHRYYEIIHKSLKAQFAHYYLFLRDTDGMTRAIQPFLIASQDIAAGTPEFVRNALAQVRRAIGSSEEEVIMSKLGLQRFLNNLVVSVVESVVFKAGHPTLVLLRRNSVDDCCCSKGRFAGAKSSERTAYWLDCRGLQLRVPTRRICSIHRYCNDASRSRF
jgi:hypothetical protein